MSNGTAQAVETAQERLVRLVTEIEETADAGCTCRSTVEIHELITECRDEPGSLLPSPRAAAIESARTLGARYRAQLIRERRDLGQATAFMRDYLDGLPATADERPVLDAFAAGIADS